MGNVFIFQTWKIFQFRPVSIGRVIILLYYSYFSLIDTKKSLKIIRTKKRIPSLTLWTEILSSSKKIQTNYLRMKKRFPFLIFWIYLIYTWKYIKIILHSIQFLNEKFSSSKYYFQRIIHFENHPDKISKKILILWTCH